MWHDNTVCCPALECSAEQGDAADIPPAGGTALRSLIEELYALRTASQVTVPLIARAVRFQNWGTYTHVPK